MELIPHGFIEPLVVPVLAHLGVNEVLIDSGKLLARHLIEDTHYFFVAFNHLPFCDDFLIVCLVPKELNDPFRRQ
jgi:hypothetical protein